MSARAQSDSAAHPWLAAAYRLKLDSLPGAIKVFHSKNHQGRAMALQVRLLEAMEFFKDSLGATQSGSLLVVDKADWVQIFDPQFWGFASNRGVSGTTQWVILQPATGDGPLAELIDDAQARVPRDLWEKLNPGTMAAAALAQRHIDLVLVHEYGHILVRGGAVPIRWGRDWFQEFLATYLMHAFLASRHPDLADFYTAWDRIVIRAARDPYTTLQQYDDGDGWQSRVGSTRLLWFYAAVGDRVRACYQRQGLDLIRKLATTLNRTAGWGMPRDELLSVLETACPGFQRWAQDMRADQSDR